MKLTIALFLFALSFAGFALGDELKEKEQLVFRKALDSYIKENNLNLQHLLNKNPNEIIGVEVVVAAGTDNAIYSKWGHALLRFVDNDGIWSNDITINFVALVNTPKLSLFKGVVGGYDILPEVKTLYDFWIQYVQVEDRSLDRYIIPTSPQQIINLLATLKSWSENPGKTGSYKFVGNNCVGVLSKLLSESGILPTNKKAIIPTNFGATLDELQLSPYEKLVVKSPFYLLPKAASILEVSPSNLMLGLEWPANSTERLLNNFNADELMFLYQTLTMMPEEVSTLILESHKEKKSHKNFKTFLGFQNIPSGLYRQCLNQECAEKTISDEEKLWGEKISKERRSKRIINLFQSPQNVSAYKNLVEQQVKAGDYTRIHEEYVGSVSRDAKIEMVLIYSNGNFNLDVFDKGEQYESEKHSNPEKIIMTRLDTNIFKIKNTNEVEYNGIVVGVLEKKLFNRSVVKFYSPYELVYKLEDGKRMSIGVVAPI